MRPSKTVRNGAGIFLVLVVLSRFIYISIENGFSGVGHLAPVDVGNLAPVDDVIPATEVGIRAPVNDAIPEQGKRFPNLLWTESSSIKAPKDWMEAIKLRDWDNIKIKSPVDKEMIPPSGDKRDFTSIVVYSWPCDKLPAVCLNYGRRKYTTPCQAPEWRICDGHFNEEGMRYSGYRDFCDFSKELEIAAGEYKLRKTHSAGAAAVRYVRSWYVNSSTAMLPRLLYSQTIPYTSDPSRKVGSNDSVIDWWRMPEMLDSITAIQDLLAEDEKLIIHTWFADFFTFISRDGVRGLHNRHPSNHGPWYDVVYYSLCVWLGQYDACREQAPWTKEKLDRMVEANGDMPHETGRKSSVYYYIYTLDSFALCAALLSQVGEDLWGYVHAKGATLRTMYEYVTPHVKDNFANWPHVTSADYRVHQLERPLLLAAVQDLRPHDMAPAELVRIAKSVRKPFSNSYLISPELVFAVSDDPAVA